MDDGLFYQLKDGLERHPFSISDTVDRFKDAGNFDPAKSLVLGVYTTSFAHIWLRSAVESIKEESSQFELEEVRTLRKRIGDIDIMRDQSNRFWFQNYKKNAKKSKHPAPRTSIDLLVQMQHAPVVFDVRVTSNGRLNQFLKTGIQKKISPVAAYFSKSVDYILVAPKNFVENPDSQENPARRKFHSQGGRLAAFPYTAQEFRDIVYDGVRDAGLNLSVD